jgi:uncharacterized protein (UPF0548 family)
MLSSNAIEALKSNNKNYNLSNAIVCTHVFSYGFWTINPCKIINILKESKVSINGEVKTVTEVVISTRKGHLIQGEERFRVVYNQDKTVDFDMYSFTKGSGLLGAIAMPLIRPLQDNFFKDNVKSMKSMMSVSQCEGNSCSIR